MRISLMMEKIVQLDLVEWVQIHCLMRIRKFALPHTFFRPDEKVCLGVVCNCVLDAVLKQSDVCTVMEA